jgi:hypothetical protein
MSAEASVFAKAFDVRQLTKKLEGIYSYVVGDDK